MNIHKIRCYGITQGIVLGLLMREAKVWNTVAVQRSGVSESQRVNQVTVRYPQQKKRLLY